MPKFTANPDLSLSSDAISAVVQKGFIYEAFYKGSDLLVEVKAGIKTDGMTLPKYCGFLRPLVPRWAYVKASLVHDVLCKERRVYNVQDDSDMLLTQKQIDDQFYFALKALGASEFRAKTYLYAVRLFQMFKHGFNNY